MMDGGVAHNGGIHYIGAVTLASAHSSAVSWLSPSITAFCNNKASSCDLGHDEYDW
jgi:hypothetical protein